MPDTKLATCCYCQRRSLLRATASEGHALACGSCGAPLTRLKSLRPAAAEAIASHGPVSHPVRLESAPAKPKPKKGKKTRGKGKRRRSLWQKLAHEVWDEIEDIFD